MKLASVMLALIVVGCASARRDEPSTAPLNVSSEKLMVGQQVFMENCFECHPGGAGGVGPAINNKPLPVFAMKTQVRLGVGPMPAFSKKKIDDEQLNALMSYLKAMRANDRKPRT